MASSAQRLKELAEAPLGRLLFKYAWPALVTMSLNALYAVVDRFYIGQGCGAEAMAGLTLAMPVIMVFSAVGMLVGIGHSTVLSLRLGEGDRVGAEKALGELVAFKVIFFVLLPLVVCAGLDTILGWCGAQRVSPGAYAAARDYLRLILFFNLFSHLAFGLSAMMRAEGAAIQSMTALVVGFGANVILDPLFIFGLGMGISGAAWATNIAMMLSCFWALGYYVRGRSAVRLRLRRIGIYPRLLGRAAAIGLAPFLQHLSGAIVSLSLAAAFARWSPDDVSATRQIASLGVFQSVMLLTFMPIHGAQQGLAPILGYNWGARNFARVAQALRLGLIATGVLCVLACLVQILPPLARMLSACFVPAADTALRHLAARDLSIANCMIWCIFVNVVATTYFQAIGRPRTAILLSALRQLVCLLPCIWLLPHVCANRTLAIWLALPLSDILANFATLPPLVRHLRFLARAKSNGA